MSAVTSGLGTASCRFAHYFVVCGIDTETGLEPDELSAEGFEQNPIQRAFRSKVLAHYPQSPDRGPLNTDAINMLCMPRGLLFRTQADSLEPHFHSFIVSCDDGTRCYGFVHTYYEEVKSVQITTAMHTLYQMHHVEHHSSSSSASASSPSSSSLDSLASSTEEADTDSSCVGCAGSYDQETDALYVSKALCLLTPLPFLQASRRFLSQLHLAAASPSAPPLPLESYVHNILYEVPLPPPGRSLRFHGVQGPIVVQRPGPEELPLGDYPLGETCALLGVEGLVQLLTCLLLETQVLLYSQDYQRLMTVAESVSTLLFPFQWQHVYLPILPAPLLHLLDAPVPFLLGVQRVEGTTRSSLHLAHEANLCFVDIDQHGVEPPEDLPLFPDQAELLQELREVLLRFGLPPHRAPATMRFGLPPHRAPATMRFGLQPHRAPATTLTPAPPCLSGLVLEDLMEDKRNGNLGGEELAVLERLQALAKSCGVGGATNTGGGVVLGRPFEEEEELRSAKLNAQLREVFACRFSAMFNRYDEFIIQSVSDLESWLSNREGSSCFDKSAFLSAQPASHVHFLSCFLETAMFSHLVEGKVTSRWAGQEPTQRLFDGRLERERLYNLDDEDPSNRRYRKCTTFHESAQTIERRLLKVDHTALHPHLLNMRIGQGRHQPGCFPCLQADVLAQGHNTNKCGMPLTVCCGVVGRWSGRGATPRRVELRPPITETSALDNDQREKHTLGRKNLQQSTLLDPSPLAVTQTHRDFVEGLLRECCLKTKRMLVERMGGHGMEQGQGEASIAGLQENTLIHGLCDLLERIWAHGLQLKQGKSALWSHLLYYQACQDKMEPPALSPVSDGVGQGRLEEGLAYRGSCLQDMRFVQAMSSSLSEVGRARAWIQLALEKKMLSPHLRDLLANQELVRQLYKPHAFLLSEEEREQFLFHLLSLNTVDYFCFTRCFTSVSIPYRVVIMPMKKLSIAMTTVTPWVCVSGELGDSGVRNIPRNIQEIYFQCKNLGRLSTLQLGQENSGLLAKCLVDCVLVYNLITGHLYRFPCGRWLGKGVGDGSLERVLIGQLVSPGGEEDAGRGAGTPLELGSPPQSGRTGLGALGGRNRMTSTEVQETLREAMNNLIKHFHKPEQERGNLTVLLCGEEGLVRSLEHFLLHGFKSSRLFQRTVFIWDFVEKAVVTMEMADQMGDLQGSTEVWDSLCRYAHAINSSQRNIGKEGKFQLLVCLGVRDRLLSRWLPLLAGCPLTVRMYEEGALLRDGSALHALYRLLHTLQDFNITLETALVKGLEL
ncbi:DENN domain-containing protein 5B-like isoform X2 [Hypomesus transpacificus]|uniref:DENN domain-containing protein 5B-like isoform X2 n=1 Tax=Hypomesus transpacificus TaxID=137520 RepID=UPI001F074F27|nr:DENN domain-containing protein 5B-like isoform X2 [Hypomesus transpacificus]